ncbi:M23 family metallopeptidase [Oerskovia turbata]
MSWHRPNSPSGRITSPFGPRGPIPGAPDASLDHLGVDLRAGTVGVPADLYAAAPGRVRRIYRTPLGAWVLELDHGGGVWTRYAHMQRAGIDVDAGDRVTGGQRIATASNSGAPTIHLHFEVLVNGRQVDPVPYLRARGVDLAVTTTTAARPSTGGSISTPTIPGRPAPIEEEDDVMLVIARTRTDPQVWIGDGITRRRIATGDTLKNVQYLATAGLLRVAKGGAVQTIEDLWALGHPVPDDLAGVQSAVTAVPGAVWGHRLQHTLAKNPDGKPATVTAGDLLRYEPAEHDATRRVVAELVAAIPGVDPAAVTAAVTQAVAGMSFTFTAKGATS